MLDQPTKERIKEEELYREEVRREIRARMPVTPLQRLSTFVNSSFGMWLFTTVIAGGAVWVLTTWRDSQRADADRRLTIQHLDTEIATRLDRLAIRLPLLQSRRQFSEAIEALDQPGSRIYGSAAYPEYAGWSLLALLRDLRGRVIESDLSDVDRALRATLNLARLGARTVDAQVDSSTGRLPIDETARAEAGRIIGDSLRIHRWVYATIQLSAPK
jgi:hypothetical protein